jgi:predicted GNAT family acetyltransferase
MNPSTRYERLTSLRRDESFDPEASQTALTLQFESEPVVKIQTKGRRTFFLRRHFSEEAEPLVVYRVFLDEGSAAAEENEVGYCRLRQPEKGIVTIAGAEVKEAFRKKGIATAVYDCIARDMERAGALLWPAAPAKMTDSEFKVWWRCSPALVFYYPHRERLGFEPRHEFEELLNEDGAAKASAKTGPPASAASGVRNKLANLRRWIASKVFRVED